MGARPAKYLFRVTDDSMTATGEENFPVGTVVMTDPEEPAIDGVYVLARAAQGVVFRRLVCGEGREVLKALNRSWPDLEAEGCEVLGVVPQARGPGRALRRN